MRALAPEGWDIPLGEPFMRPALSKIRTWRNSIRVEMQQDADLVPNSNAPYELLVETTEGGFFNRIEGQPARNPSFWIRSVHFVHTYEKVGPFWFASATRTKSEIRIFGSSELTIENSDYTLNPPIDHITEADRQARLIQ